MTRTYRVIFWRAYHAVYDWTGLAANEVEAVRLAMAHHGITEWVTERGFRVEIFIA